MIDLNGVSKSFRSVEALRDAGFQAPDGGVTGMIGPNGAGKTTALRILYTVLRPDSGVALIDGFDTVRQRAEVQARIGVVPDGRGLYPRLTAREHIRYFGRLHGLGGRDLERRIDTLAQTLRMEAFVDRRAKGFSKGQVRKVALARALVHDPQNILLDEPTNGLDVASSRAVHDLIRELRDRGRCILFCSHIMQEVAEISDRIVVIAGGRVLAEDSQQALLAASGTDSIERAFLALTGEAEGT